jgi:hypothetical protein
VHKDIQLLGVWPKPDDTNRTARGRLRCREMSRDCRTLESTPSRIPNMHVSSRAQTFSPVTGLIHRELKDLAAWSGHIVNEDDRKRGIDMSTVPCTSPKCESLHLS